MEYVAQIGNKRNA